MVTVVIMLALTVLRASLFVVISTLAPLIAAPVIAANSACVTVVICRAGLPHVLALSVTVAASMRRFAERGRVRLEGRASEVGRVLGQALEADEIGVLVANHLAFNEEIVLLLHHLLENGPV